MSPDLNKKVKTFRLTPDACRLVEEAADQTGLSEGEIIEGCIVAQAEGLVRRHEVQRELLKRPEAVAAVAAAGSRRPRDERADKGKVKGPRAGLTKPQQQ